MVPAAPAYPALIGAKPGDAFVTRLAGGFPCCQGEAAFSPPDLPGKDAERRQRLPVGDGDGPAFAPFFGHDAT